MLLWVVFIQLSSVFAGPTHGYRILVDVDPTRAFVKANVAGTPLEREWAVRIVDGETGKAFFQTRFRRGSARLQHSLRLFRDKASFHADVLLVTRGENEDARALASARLNANDKTCSLTIFPTTGRSCYREYEVREKLSIDARDLCLSCLLWMRDATYCNEISDSDLISGERQFGADVSRLDHHMGVIRDNADRAVVTLSVSKLD